MWNGWDCMVQNSKVPQLNEKISQIASVMFYIELQWNIPFFIRPYFVSLRRFNGAEFIILFNHFHLVGKKSKQNFENFSKCFGQNNFPHRT